MLAKEQAVSKDTGEKYDAGLNLGAVYADMLVDKAVRFFIDWEGDFPEPFNRRHRLLFRYRAFSAVPIPASNSAACRKPPENGVELPLFRDLVNPPRLPSSKQEAPLRDAGPPHIIENDLAYGDY